MLTLKQRVEVSLSMWMKASRWREFATTKVPLIWPPAAVLLIHSTTTRWSDDLSYLAGITAFTALYLSFGYMLNDWSDAVPDRIAGKPNYFGTLPTGRAALTLGLVAGASIAALSPLWNHQTWSGMAAAVALVYLAAIAYSIHPVRLKERGFLGLMVGAAAQRVGPMLVLFAAAGVWDITQFSFLTLGLCTGLRWMLAHQISDYRSDILAGVNTFVTQKGIAGAERLLGWLVFPLEIVLILITVFASMSLWLASYLLIGLVFELGVRGALHRRGIFRFSLSTFAEIPLGVFYFLFWPVISWLFHFKQPILALSGIGLTLIWQLPYIRNEGVQFVRLVQLALKKQHPEMSGTSMKREQQG